MEGKRNINNGQKEEGWIGEWEGRTNKEWNKEKNKQGRGGKELNETLIE
jgi:hypothetical protein